MRIAGAEIRARRDELGLSQAALGAMIGTTQQTIDRIERGESRHSRFLEAAKTALKLQPLTDHDEQAIYFERRARRQNQREEMEAIAASALSAELPVYTIHMTGDQVVSVEPYDFIPRPFILGRVRGAYAVIVLQDDMSPALRAGDIAFLNPHIPPRPTNEILLRQAPEFEGDAPVLLRTLVGSDETSWMVRTWQPAGQEVLRRAEWPAAHVVVAKYARV